MDFPVDSCASFKVSFNSTEYHSLSRKVLSREIMRLFVHCTGRIDSRDLYKQLFSIPFEFLRFEGSFASIKFDSYWSDWGPEDSCIDLFIVPPAWYQECTFDDHYCSTSNITWHFAYCLMYRSILYKLFLDDVKALGTKLFFVHCTVPIGSMGFQKPRYCEEFPWIHAYRFKGSINFS